MIAYASGSGGVMFVPEEIERKTAEKKKPALLRRSNDNKTASKAEQRKLGAPQVEAAE